MRPMTPGICPPLNDAAYRGLRGAPSFCLCASNKVMSLYRYELQYHDMQPTQIAPGKIRQYPQNLGMQSVAGRNLANTAWDILAAKQQQGHEAM